MLERLLPLELSFVKHQINKCLECILQSSTSSYSSSVVLANKKDCGKTFWALIIVDDVVVKDRIPLLLIEDDKPHHNLRFAQCFLFMYQCLPVSIYMNFYDAHLAYTTVLQASLMFFVA